MLTITALTTDTARALQAGGLDANGQTPERSTSGGAGNPCRHCLRYIPEGADMLILAHRPFPDPQPYAEVGPIFLCAEECARHEGDAMPEVLQGSPDYLIKGYGQDDRIVYGTGAVVEAERMMGQAEEIFADPRIAYIHIRSARNNCYQARIDRE
ncbi:hypothetical protein JL2886_01813 [Phaeobacter gallaeciensis]|uniref:DUF1203 domain-containing protein n=1 Tax=Phaeobacter gallaeciensis TaxID=60890 RepID=A0A1B0ZRG5_9RHOB|nr:MULTISPECIES: DUF1203 domain-containing protein [Phaeobacter]MDF1771919.1 DUF1203 domain-containing protein [Pseudophaeobacter sp. bin_em_oilr2.035]MEE2632942.1 DUF1203 domain-containing protein [Pseudomonadota bacterium]ANP36721.1 hypothetical protein JL2886_01813 [Phaeobacter gallaeciensis]MDE4060406.1 DUF1203 domain-containing protein [Phaeobacter gallaeciensis]MDE4123425.1 DUF1203 domain-containing protein [Phaeobacter gallaeciensis]